MVVADLVARGSDLDGHNIRLRGEAIGDVLRADEETVWVHVLSGGTAVGVVMDRATAETIPRLGRYRRIGSTLEIEGVFNVACDEHGGDLDVHAVSVEVLDEGSEYADPPSVWQLAISMALFALAAVAVALQRRMRRKFDAG